MNGAKRWQASLITILFFNTSVVMAELTANVTLTSNYITNGISQTGDDPALQAGLDYEHQSGFYVGAWASNVELGYEADAYVGYMKEVDNLGIDLGYTSFNYTDNNFEEDTSEIYIGCICKVALLFYSEGEYQGFDYEYYEIISEYDIENIASIGFHYGYAKLVDVDVEFYDYEVSISKKFKGFKYSLTYSVGEFVDDEVTYFSISKDFKL